MRPTRFPTSATARAMARVLPLAVCLCTAVGLGGTTAAESRDEAPAVASTANAGPPAVARPARPKVKSDGNAVLPRGGYAPRYYFAEGTSFRHTDSYVFYEPVIYMETDDRSNLRHHVGDNGQLILYFHVESNLESYLLPEIRESLIRAAKRSEVRLTPASYKYRITPLSMSASWFESYSSRLGLAPVRSARVRSSSLHEKGSFPIFFHLGSPEAAEGFVSDLQTGRDQLVFVYQFAGVGDQICLVKFEEAELRELDLFNELDGPGGEGFVTRHQAAGIADRIAATVDLAVRCPSLTSAGDLVDRMFQLVSPRPRRIDSWERLDDLVALDAESFKADVQGRIERIEKDTVRKQAMRAFSDAMSKAISEASEYGVALGWAPALAAVNASFADMDAETYAAASQALSDSLRNHGVYSNVDQRVVIPKSVDIYSVADLEDRWGRDFEIRYEVTHNELGGDSIVLTRETWTAVETLESRVLAKTDRKIETLRKELEEARETAREALDAAGKALAAADDSATAASNANAAAAAARRNADRARRNAKAAAGAANGANSEARAAARAALRTSGAVDVRNYRFSLDADLQQHYFDTGYGVKDYPGAFIAFANQYRECDVNFNHSWHSRMVVFRERWHILLQRAPQYECRRLDATVIFMKDQLVGRSHHWVGKSLTSYAPMVKR